MEKQGGEKTKNLLSTPSTSPSSEGNRKKCIFCPELVVLMSNTENETGPGSNNNDIIRAKMIKNYCHHLNIPNLQLPDECPKVLCTGCEVKMEELWSYRCKMDKLAEQITAGIMQDEFKSLQEGTTNPPPEGPFGAVRKAVVKREFEKFEIICQQKATEANAGNMEQRRVSSASTVSAATSSVDANADVAAVENGSSSPSVEDEARDEVNERGLENGNNNEQVDPSFETTQNINDEHQEVDEQAAGDEGHEQPEPAGPSPPPVVKQEGEREEQAGEGDREDEKDTDDEENCSNRELYTVYKGNKRKSQYEGMEILSIMGSKQQGVKYIQCGVQGCTYTLPKLKYTRKRDKTAHQKLKAHMRQAHKHAPAAAPKRERTHTCYICSNTFATMELLSLHKIIHGVQNAQEGNDNAGNSDDGAGRRKSARFPKLPSSQEVGKNKKSSNHSAAESSGTANKSSNSSVTKPGRGRPKKNPRSDTVAETDTAESPAKKRRLAASTSSQNSDTEQLSCKTCNRVFKKKVDLSRHLITHTNQNQAQPQDTSPPIPLPPPPQNPNNEAARREEILAVLASMDLVPRVDEPEDVRANAADNNNAERVAERVGTDLWTWCLSAQK